MSDAAPGSPSRRKKAAEDGSATTRRRGFWGGNLEAFTVAIVMALVIKTYAFEAFQVPTESMEPTIIGRTPGGDRIIVNKFVYEFQDPQRFEVVVFRYPLARRVNYVKRLVGLPGEDLKIAHGDIYTKSAGGGAYEVARKPLALCDAIFRDNPVFPEETLEDIQSTSFREQWRVPPVTGVRIDGTGGILRMDAGDERLLLSTREPITPARRDAWAHDRDGKGDLQLDVPIGDLRLDVEVVPGDGCRGVVMVIEDGTQPEQPIELVLGTEGGGSPSALRHGGEALGGNDEPAGGPLGGVRLAPGEEVALRLENCDDRIRVCVDGEEVLSHPYRQDWRPTTPGQSRVRFGLLGGDAVFSRVALYRDLYYTVYEPGHADFAVPEGHHLFFGDNSPNSLDARGWRVVGIRLREDGRILLGDLEAVSDSFEWPRRDNNPYFEIEPETLPGGRKVAKRVIDPDVHHFLDIFGNEWDLETGSYDILDLSGFGVADGSPAVLELHGTTLEDPAPGQIGIAEVTTPVLKERTRPTELEGQHAFRAYSRLMHYVARKDVMGQANLIFWPPGRWGVIR